MRVAFVCAFVAACGLFPDVGDFSADGGSDGTALDGAGADAGADAGGDATETVPCPDGGGPSMVSVGPFCIDSTEVTAAQYEAFTAASPPLSLLPPLCAFKTGWTSSQYAGALPIREIDWCDAYAFCKWAGKRLCGDVDGGPSEFQGYTSSNNEWFYACTADGSRLYPYGNGYDGGVCNDVDYGVGTTIPVASDDSCVGGFPGVHDMAGNVWEWEDSCADDGGAGDLCRVRGGCWVDGASQTACAFDSFDHFTTTRGSPSSFVGFRCCAP